MSSAVGRGVFISYSRVNGEVVTIAAKLLRAGGATVFQDVVDVDYGSDWQEALASAIRQCERVLVFWSLAASTSEWVEREWRMALQAGKRIVPMLLDRTPLPTELSRFNGMPELMQLLMLVKQPDAPVAPELSLRPRPAPARRRSFLLPSIGVAFAAVFCVVLFYGHRSPVQVPPPAPASSAGLPGEALGLPAGGWLPAIAVVVLLILGAAFLVGRRKGRLGASSDVQTRRVLEIGPLFTRQLFE